MADLRRIAFEVFDRFDLEIGDFGYVEPETYSSPFLNTRIKVDVDSPHLGTEPDAQKRLDALAGDVRKVDLSSAFTVFPEHSLAGPRWGVEPADEGVKPYLREMLIPCLVATPNTDLVDITMLRSPRMTISSDNAFDWFTDTMIENFKAERGSTGSEQLSEPLEINRFYAQIQKIESVTSSIMKTSFLRACMWILDVVAQSEVLMQNTGKDANPNEPGEFTFQNGNAFLKHFYHPLADIVDFKTTYAALRLAIQTARQFLTPSWFEEYGIVFRQDMLLFSVAMYYLTLDQEWADEIARFLSNYDLSKEDFSTMKDWPADKGTRFYWLLAFRMGYASLDRDVTRIWPFPQGIQDPPMIIDLETFGGEYRSPYALSSYLHSHQSRFVEPYVMSLLHAQERYLQTSKNAIAIPGGMPFELSVIAWNDRQEKEESKIDEIAWIGIFSEDTLTKERKRLLGLAEIGNEEMRTPFGEAHILSSRSKYTLTQTFTVIDRPVLIFPTVLLKDGTLAIGEDYFFVPVNQCLRCQSRERLLWGLETGVERDECKWYVEANDNFHGSALGKERPVFLNEEHFSLRWHLDVMRRELGEFWPKDTSSFLMAHVAAFFWNWHDPRDFLPDLSEQEEEDFIGILYVFTRSHYGPHKNGFGRGYDENFHNAIKRATNALVKTATELKEKREQDSATYGPVEPDIMEIPEYLVSFDGIVEERYLKQQMESAYAYPKRGFYFLGTHSATRFLPDYTRTGTAPPSPSVVTDTDIDIEQRMRRLRDIALNPAPSRQEVSRAAFEFNDILQQLCPQIATKDFDAEQARHEMFSE